jgi:dienelactone hydrolase
MDDRILTFGGDTMPSRYPRTNVQAVVRTVLLSLAAAAVSLACSGDAKDPIGPGAPEIQQSSGRDESADERTVKGRITNAATGNPVAGAEVRIGTDVVTTGEDGHFALDLPSESESTLRCTAAGYVAFETVITPTSDNVRQDIGLTRIEVFEFGVFAVFVPAHVDIPNGIILALGGPDTRAFATGKRFGAPLPDVEASFQLLGQDMRALASSSGLAIIGSSRVNLGLPNSPDTDQLLSDGIATAAALGGRPDLSTAPILVYGLSGGGREASGFTARNPQRVAGLFLKVPASVSLLTDGEALGVPTYMVLAGLDLIVNNAALTAAFEANRGAGALWGMAMEPGVMHHSLSTFQRQVTVSWMTTVLDRRLPPHQWAGPLRDIAEKHGWLGDLATGVAAPWHTYDGDRASASWLPSEMTAREWEQLVGASAITVANQESPVR